MKLIGLLGAKTWASTAEYCRLANELHDAGVTRPRTGRSYRSSRPIPALRHRVHRISEFLAAELLPPGRGRGRSHPRIDVVEEVDAASGAVATSPRIA
ncbi:hypothetical protein ACFQ9V_19975 [Leifsonia sp. NPDC056665]|uniref:hypothetical protein n=1 Tax=Leifsonia sp. NPDC056665 TaxID=3345901 RepID=UPI00367971A1